MTNCPQVRSLKLFLVIPSQVSIIQCDVPYLLALERGGGNCYKRSGVARLGLHISVDKFKTLSSKINIVYFLFSC